MLSLFACWFQPAQTSPPTVFFSHRKPAPASQPKPAPAPTSEQARSLNDFIKPYCASGFVLFEALLLQALSHVGFVEDQLFAFL